MNNRDTPIETDPAAEPEYRARIRARLATLVEELYGRQPRWRYFQRGNGPMYVWTVETVNVNGKPRYQSLVYKPTGAGSRSGKATNWSVDPAMTSSHRLRRDAKARALKLFEADKEERPGNG